MTQDRWNRVVVAGIAAVALTATPVSAGKLTPVEKCASSKLTAQATHFNQTMTCNTKVKLAAPDPLCVQKATDKLTKSFTNAEKPGACKANGDAPAVAAMNITVVQEVVGAVSPPLGPAAPKPQTKCAVAKAAAASKESASNTKCQKNNLSTPSDSLLSFCLGQATSKTEATFDKAEAPGACATVGDAPVVVAHVEALRQAVVHALVPPTPTPTAGPTPTSVPCTGLVDNGNGTITDCSRHLMWEKKDDAGGIHDVNNTYTWSNSGTAADGTAFTVFLATLNTLPCFAGHCDWRLPTIAGYGPGASGQAAELESIVDTSVPGCNNNFDQACVVAPFNNNCTPACNATTCSCTTPHEYWSASTIANQTNAAWLVFFDDGTVFGEPKNTPIYVRAVRSIP